jgi:hypothetical protein
MSSRPSRSLSARPIRRLARDLDAPVADAGFYGRIVREVEDARRRDALERRSREQREAEGKVALHRAARAWWDDIFTPELSLAREELHAQGLMLDWPPTLAKDRPEAGSIERSLVFQRFGRRFPPYVIVVRDGAIRLSQARFPRAVPVQGYVTALAVGKASPEHARLMITTIIKDCLAQESSATDGDRATSWRRVGVPA